MAWDYFTYVDAVLSKESGLTPPQRLVLITMARYNEFCWASNATIGIRTGLHRVTVNHAQHAAEKAGWLVKDGSKGWRLCVAEGYKHVAQDYTGIEIESSAPLQVSSAGLQGSSAPLQDGVAQDYTKENIKRVMKEPRKSIDEPFILDMVKKHEGRLTEVQVREEITNALNHTASKKWLSKQLGVQNWLNNSVKFREERNGGRNGKDDGVRSGSTPRGGRLGL
jgi:hypothetical protein